VNELVAIIDRIIEEHQKIGRSLQALEKASNDTEAIMMLQEDRKEMGS